MYSHFLKHYPDHDKGLILMGDINVNYLKDLNAAEKVQPIIPIILQADIDKHLYSQYFASLALWFLSVYFIFI